MGISRVQVPVSATDVGAGSLTATSSSTGATDLLTVNFGGNLTAGTYSITWSNISFLGSSLKTALLDEAGNSVGSTSHSGTTVVVSASGPWNRAVLYNAGGLMSFNSGAQILSLVKGQRTVDASASLATWTQRASLTGLNANHYSRPHQWAVVGDEFFAVHTDTGNQSNPNPARLVKFSNSTNTWTVLATLPEPGANNSLWGPSMVNLPGALHVMGGQQYSGSSWSQMFSHYRYDLTTNSWSSRSTSQWDAQAQAVVFPVSTTNFHYLGGLGTNFLSYNAHHAYNQSTNTWTGRTTDSNAMSYGNHFTSDGSTAIYSTNFGATYTYSVSGNSWSNTGQVRTEIASTNMNPGRYFRDSAGTYYLNGPSPGVTVQISGLTTQNPFTTSGGTLRRRAYSSGVSAAHYTVVPGTTVLFSTNGSGPTMTMFTTPIDFPTPPAYLQ